MFAPVTHILPLTIIERERVLPVPGKVLARLNQKVNPTDVIAEAEWAREHVLLEVARAFGLSPEAADRLIRCKVGDRLNEGASVAVVNGLIARAVRAPRAGRVVAVGGGQVLIETGEAELQLRAGLPGLVVNIIPERGAVIRTAGALAQGLWGNGRVDAGLLLNLSEKPDDVLEAGRLDVSMRGSILLCGHCREAEALRAAAELPLRGLILGSLSPGLAALALQMRYPILAMDGLGNLPMNTAAYKILSTNAKREVTVNAEPFDRYSGARPEAMIPLPVTQEPPAPRPLQAFAPGQQVRLRRAPHTGAIATLVSLRPDLTTLPSGLRAAAADVQLEGGETLVVPLANLEVVG